MAKGRAARRVIRRGGARVRARVTFRPVAGAAQVQHITLRLIRQR
jgi:hypothetical protein